MAPAVLRLCRVSLRNGLEHARVVRPSLPAAFFLLWKSESPSRHTFLPPHFTSKEYSMNSATPLVELLITREPRGARAGGSRLRERLAQPQQ